MSETEQDSAPEEVVDRDRPDQGYQLGDEGYVEGLGPQVFPPNVDPRDYPPYKMSPSAEAATVGRFVIDQVRESPPQLLADGRREYATGRTVAAPQGVFYSRDETDPNAERGEGVSVYEAAVAAQSEAVRSATPDMAEPEEGGHLSDVEKGAKSGPFVDRKAPEAGFGALDEGTVERLNAKHEEEVLARQGVKDGSVLPLSEPAKPATSESVDAAFEVTEAAEDALVNDESIPLAEDGQLTYTPEEQVDANYEAQPDDGTADPRQKIVEIAGAKQAVPADAEGTTTTDEGGTVLDQIIAEERPSEGEEPVEEAADESWNVYTVAELKAELDSRSIAYDSGARKADLVALLEADDEAG